MKFGNKLGMIGLMLGLGGFITFGSLSLLGMIVSMIALRRNRNDTAASWGIIVSAIPCIFWFFWWLFVIILRY